MTIGNPAEGPDSALKTASSLDRHIAAVDHGVARRPDAAARRPLTHHEILGLIEPFTRRGRHVDLAASDRMERRLAFRPVAHDASEIPACAGANELLQLENPRPEFFRLTRTVTLESGAKAKLTTEGANPGELLARIETIALEGQFQFVAGIPIARSYRLDPDKGDKTQPLRLVLASAEARLDGLTLALKADTGRGYPAEIEIHPQPDGPKELLDDLPEDLLATLGWNWRVLRRRGAGWTSALRVRGREPRRSRRIEIALEQTVAHLARTLAEPPRQFHDRLVRARWTVVFRRMMPLLLAIALIGGAAAMTYVDVPPESVMLMMNLPPLMLLMLFGMRELPRFEIPPLPRPSRAPSWFPPRDGGDGLAQPADLKQGV